MIVCKNPSEECFRTTCKSCPGIDGLYDYLDDIFQDTEATQIIFKQWINEPRCTLDTLTKSIEEFKDYFCDSIENLLTHDFICKEQHKYINNLKKNLRKGEFMCQLDFAENYAFVVQNAAQAFHWNNNQATIFTAVVYYTVGHELKNINFIVTSDNLIHDAVAVYTYIEKIVIFLKKNFKPVKKIYYVSDGAPQQFKNYKNILTIYNHKKDFKVDVEWDFFPTAHGKGACDGLGGSAKRGAASASLQLPPDKQILTPISLHNWFTSSGRFKNVNFIYSSKSDYLKNEKKLEKRFENDSRVKDLRKQHCVIPKKNGVECKNYSNAKIVQFDRL